MLQVCSIDMTVDQDTMMLIPGELVMKQDSDMNLFRITEQSLVYSNPSKQKDGIKMQIKMKRKIMSEMMTTYFPSLLLMLITFATTFFKPVFFEAALSVNLTTMLVMTTIFISKMESLPPTSAIKMIDIWLIICQIVPFLEVVLLTAMEYNRKEKKKGKKTKKKGKGKTKNLQRTTLTVAPMKENMLDGELKTGRLSFNCGIPSLKTLGKFEHVKQNDQS